TAHWRKNPACATMKHSALTNRSGGSGMAKHKSGLLGRREFLGTLTVAATGALPAAARAAGENTAQLAPAPNVIDFHNHYVGPNFPLTTLAKAPPVLQPVWRGINRNLADA